MTKYQLEQFRKQQRNIRQSYINIKLFGEKIEKLHKNFIRKFACTRFQIDTISPTASELYHRVSKLMGYIQKEVNPYKDAALPIVDKQRQTTLNECYHVNAVKNDIEQMNTEIEPENKEEITLEDDEETRDLKRLINYLKSLEDFREKVQTLRTFFSVSFTIYSDSSEQIIAAKVRRYFDWISELISTRIQRVAIVVKRRKEK